MNAEHPKPKMEFTKGLEGIVAGQNTICSIDAEKLELSYRGYMIHDLVANSTYEETAYLLLFHELPTKDKLKEFKKRIAEARVLPKPVIDSIKRMPKDAPPMAALRTAISLLGTYDPDAVSDNSRKEELQRDIAIRLIAQFPVIVAYFERIRNGKPIVRPKKSPRVSNAENFLWMIKGEMPTELEKDMLDKYLMLLAEHDYNASTFASRVTASTLSDFYSAITSAIGTLKGDLHGSACRRAMETLIKINDVSNVESFVEEALKNKAKIMGFGHRVYKGPDPRSKDLKAMAKQLAETFPEQSKWYKICEKLEQTVLEKKKLTCNVDFYSAPVLYTIGIPVDLFTTMFAMSRIAGWSAHVLAQYADNRLIRPVSEYVGEVDRKYVPIKKRK